MAILWKAIIILANSKNGDILRREFLDSKVIKENKKDNKYDKEKKYLRTENKRNTWEEWQEVKGKQDAKMKWREVMKKRVAISKLMLFHLKDLFRSNNSRMINRYFKEFLFG